MLQRNNNSENNITHFEKRQPKSGKVKKMVILLHGLGADGHDLIDLSDFFIKIYPDAVFIAPNAPYNCDMAPMGYQWFSLQERTTEAMLPGLKNAINILDEFISKQINSYHLKYEDVILVGFSQGTMTSLYYALTSKNKIKGVLGYSGALIGIDELDKSKLNNIPICLIHGDEDMVVPFAEMQIAQETLEKKYITIETHRCEYLGHGIDEKGLRLGQEFLKKIG